MSPIPCHFHCDSHLWAEKTKPQLASPSGCQEIQVSGFSAGQAGGTVPSSRLIDSRGSVEAEYLREELQEQEEREHCGGEPGGSLPLSPGGGRKPGSRAALSLSQSSRKQGKGRRNGSDQL